MVKIGAKGVSIVGYGRGADAATRVSFPCTVVAINPLDGPYNPSSTHVHYLVTQPDDYASVDPSFVHIIQESDVQHCRLDQSSKTRLDFSDSLCRLIVNLLSLPSN